MDAANKSYGPLVSAVDSSHPCGRIEPLRRLASVGITGKALAPLRSRNIDVVGRRKLHRILPVGNLVEVERNLPAAVKPGIVRQQGKQLIYNRMARGKWRK